MIASAFRRYDIHGQEGGPQSHFLLVGFDVVGYFLACLRSRVRSVPRSREISRSTCPSRSNLPELCSWRSTAVTDDGVVSLERRLNERAVRTERAVAVLEVL